MAHLNIQLASGGSPVRFPLEGGIVQLGRSSSCELQIPDDRVSRIHAALEVQEGCWGIRDLQSNNGTMLNGRPLAPRVWTPLRSGDWVRVAREVAEIEFVLPEPAETQVRFSNTAFEEGKTIWSEPSEVWLETENELVAAAGESASAVDLQQQLLRVRERSRRQARHLQLLTELTRSLTAEFSLSDVYDRCIELLLQTTPADRITILQLAEDGERLEPVLRCRPGRERLKRVVLSETIVRRAMSKKKSVLWHSTLESSGESPGSLVSNGIHTVMCAPLIGRSTVLGAIYVDRQSPHQTFEIEHLELLNAIAGPTGLAIDNVLSFERLRKEEATRLAYNRFLPPHLTERLVGEPDSIQLGGVDQVVSILFSDIRGFTRIAEKRDPERVISLLNRYFSEMVQVVFRYGGTLDKFLGDGLMALFGAPEVGPGDPAQAVQAAIAMQRRMEVLRESVPEFHKEHIQIGIGINTGVVTVGYLGTDRRTDYTAVGDAVNIAARLESEAAPGQILVSGETAHALAGTVPLQALGSKVLKGREQPVEMFDLPWNDDFGATR